MFIRDGSIGDTDDIAGSDKTSDTAAAPAALSLPQTTTVVAAGAAADPAHALVDYLSSIVDDSELDRAALETLGTPVIVVNKDMLIVRVNNSAEIFFGYTQLQLLGKSVETLIPESKREVHAKVHTPRYRIFPQPRQMGSKLAEVTALASSGEEVPVRISLAPFQMSRGRFFSASVHLVDEVRG